MAGLFKTESVHSLPLPIDGANKPSDSSSPSRDAAGVNTVVSGEGAADENVYPVGWKLICIFIGLYCAIFCLGLDRAILATAVPKITSEFNSLNDIAWYGSAYMLTSSCFQLMFGKLYAEFGVKYVFVASISIFEVGSIICAAAPSSVALIVGRAIAGIGASGLLTGGLVIIAAISSLKDRPKFTGMIASAMGVSMAVAPTLGGAFTDYLTWRWCFWINIPLGGVTILVVILFLHLPTKPSTEPPTVRAFLAKFDLVGTIILLPGIVSILLALQWAGSLQGGYPWGDWRIILLFCVAGACFLAWLAVQWREGDRATVPGRIIKMRSIACAMWFVVCTSAVIMVISYYAPFWFQSARGVSAYQTGINCLAITISMLVTAFSSGFLTSKIGYYVPQMIASSVILSIATGLITRFDMNTSTGYWMISFILLGAGFGIGGQNSLMVAQTVLKGKDIALGISMTIFAQTMSATIFLAIAENVFHGRLVSELYSTAPGLDPHAVLAAGASDIAGAIGRLYPGSEGSVQGVLVAYERALGAVFIVAAVMACLSIFGSAFCEWRSVRRDGELMGKGKTDAGRGSGEKGRGEEQGSDIEMSRIDQVETPDREEGERRS